MQTDTETETGQPEPDIQTVDMTCWGLTVRITLTPGNDGPVVSLEGLNCGVEDFMSGEYLLTQLATE